MNLRPSASRTKREANSKWLFGQWISNNDVENNRFERQQVGDTNSIGRKFSCVAGIWQRWDNNRRLTISSLATASTDFIIVHLPLRASWTSWPIRT